MNQKINNSSQTKSRFLFINSDDEELGSPMGSPSPLVAHAFDSLSLASPRIDAKSPKVQDDRKTQLFVHSRNGNSPLTPVISLQTLFQLISVPHVIAIIRVLLLERSVIFLSSQYSLLTGVMESIKELLYCRRFMMMV